MSEIIDMDASNNNALAAHTSGDPKMTRRLRSLVWNDFTKEKKPDGNCVAICNHCKKQLTASSRSGTTHLRNHLATCMSTKVRVKRKKLLVRRIASKLSEAMSYEDYKSNFDQELSQQDLAKMVVFHGYPFTIVHHIGFRTFVRNLQPHFKLMPEDVLKAECMKIYEDGRSKLREMLEKLSCRVSLTVDMWRSREDMADDYMSLTCHYIDDDWKLKTRILNFLHVDDLISGEEIGKKIVEKLQDWNIDRKLFSIILDNCSYNHEVASELPKFVPSKGSLPLNGDLFHVQGAATVLNLIAKYVLELAREVISKVRDAVQSVRSSLANLTKFQIASRKVGVQKELVLDVPDNFSSTYLMLETACEFQDVFTCYAEDDSEDVISLCPEDWDLARAVTGCLDLFYQAIIKVSGARIPTANFYFNEICEIHFQLKVWCTSPIPVFASISSEIFENFEQYWGATRRVLAVASILDPRYKLKPVEYFFKQTYGDTYETTGKIENIRQCLGVLYNEYAVQSNDVSKTQAFLCYISHTNDGASTEWGTGAESKTPRITLSDTRKGLNHYIQETSSSQTQKSDLDLYLDEAVYRSNIDDENFNLLAWWKYHAAKYPVLSTMARDILGIPVSIYSLDSKSRILDHNLSCMDPVIVQGLKCGQDWLKEAFEVHVDPPAPLDTIVTAPLTVNLDGGVDECMIPTANEELLLVSN